MDFRVDFPTLTLLIVKKYTMVVAIVWYIVIYGFSVTLVTAKKQKLLWCGRVHAREKMVF